jgi:hypothetical protein
VLGEDKSVDWTNQGTKVTLPGRPVSLKLSGSNVVMALQFTPYFKAGGGGYLVAQGQIWTDEGERGVRYNSTMQSIPIQLGESVVFYPMGQGGGAEDGSIEILLELLPYK